MVVERGVDVVVPVFNARAETLRCLKSVLRHAEGDFRLVVIDDASTDPELWPALERVARSDERVLLQRNEQNLGFVRTCNRAFAAAAGRDLLLLNSDTEVFRDFLGRLRACVYADDRTGIVSPLSNNATICSVPEFCRANELPPGISAKQMAALVRKTSERRRPEIVTPIGFCMYIRAELLAEIGAFDAERFGRGFGEENDFGERAKAAGWTLRLADDVYVWHEGKASFGEEGSALEARNAPALEARHHGYHARVARFIRENPLAPVQDDLRFHLARWRQAEQPAVMMLLHASPFREPCGGTEYVVRDLVKHARLPRTIVAYPGDCAIELAEVLYGEWDGASVHRFPLPSPVPRFCHEHDAAARCFEEILELFRVGHVHVHHLIGWPLALERVLDGKRIPHSITVHDFYCICPSQNLLDPTSRRGCCPASIGDSQRTGACMRALFGELALPLPGDPVAFVEAHRDLQRHWFSNAAAILFPSASARQILEAVHPLAADRVRVLPHAYLPVSNGARTVSEPGARLRVALVGEVAYPSKGADGYLEVMRRLRNEPIEWHIFGPTDRFGFEQRLASLGRDVRIVRHGSYTRGEIVSRLHHAGIELGLLLPIWPETFSLTLSELLAAGVPVLAARRGALHDRLEGRPYARVVEGPDEAAQVLSELCGERSLVTDLKNGLQTLEPPDVAAWINAHRDIYANHCTRSGWQSLKRRDHLRLAESRISPAMRPNERTLQPAARFREARWYRAAERLKPYLPESVRALARRRLSDDRLRTIRRFRLPGRHARAGADLRLDARYLTTARFTSLGPDPRFYLQVDPISPDQVGAIRFNVWCSNPGSTRAQLFWRHDGDPGFSDRKSLTVELDGRLGDWQEYVVRLDRTAHPSWFTGQKLVELRFHPVSYAGLFCVGELALCRASPTP